MNPPTIVQPGTARPARRRVGLGLGAAVRALGAGVTIT
jgi:hypothetical protein